jgi:hypothetical protein
MIGYAIFFQCLEALALITGIYFYNRNKDKNTLYLIRFLSITVFVELLGWYPSFIDANGIFSFLKGTSIETNYWIYNIYHIISALFYISYFKWYLKSKKAVFILNFLSIMFFIGAVLYLVFSGIFFVAFSPFTLIVGTILIFLSIALYYLELLKSDQILIVHKTLPFYISVGASIFHLCTTPIYIYSLYFSKEDLNFLKVYLWINYSSNLILYTIFILGFLICSKRKNPY